MCYISRFRLFDGATMPWLWRAKTLCYCCVALCLGYTSLGGSSYRSSITYRPNFLLVLLSLALLPQRCVVNPLCCWMRMWSIISKHFWVKLSFTVQNYRKETIKKSSARSNFKNFCIFYYIAQSLISVYWNVLRVNNMSCKILFSVIPVSHLLLQSYSSTVPKGCTPHTALSIYNKNTEKI